MRPTPAPCTVQHWAISEILWKVNFSHWGETKSLVPSLSFLQLGTFFSGCTIIQSNCAPEHGIERHRADCEPNLILKAGGIFFFFLLCHHMETVSILNSCENTRNVMSWKCETPVFRYLSSEKKKKKREPKSRKYRCKGAFSEWSDLNFIHALLEDHVRYKYNVFYLSMSLWLLIITNVI